MAFDFDEQESRMTSLCRLRQLQTVCRLFQLKKKVAIESDPSGLYLEFRTAISFNFRNSSVGI